MRLRFGLSRDDGWLPKGSRRSRSLGECAYRHYLEKAELRLIGCQVDEGGNNNFDTVRLADRT